MRIEPNEPYLKHIESDAAGRVRSSLRRTMDGASVDLITPLISRSETPDEGRIHLRDELMHHVVSTGYDWLDEAEQDQADKIGAYSIMLPYAERRSDVEAYFQSRSHQIDEVDLALAVLQVQAKLGMRDLRPISLQEAYNEMPVGTNLGAPFFTSNKQFRSSVLRLAREIESKGYKGWNVENDPALLYWRGQPKGLGEVPKQRVVWGMPHWLTLFELQLQVPMLRLARNRPEFASWVNQYRVNHVVTTMFENVTTEILSVDFSKFDATLPGTVILAGFDLIRTIFQEEYGPLIDLVEDRFMNIPLLTPDGMLSGRMGAVPSGSGLTNWMDTVCHDIMWHYVALKIHNPIIGALFQGDDAVIQFQGKWDIQEIENIFKDHFGMEMSNEKGGISTERIYFLQNVHSTDYYVDGENVNVRPVMRCLNGMMSYERLVNQKWVSYDDTLRWWQQAENCKYHPKFLELGKFLYRHDKYSRTLSASEVLNRAGGWKQAESVLKQPSFPFGKESLSGLENFRIVQVLDALQHWEIKRELSFLPAKSVG